MDVDATILKMLKISELIMTEIECLEDLSYAKKENTDQFDDHVTDIGEYIKAENEILDSLDDDTLYQIYLRLPDFDDNSNSFKRVSTNIDDYVADLPIIDEDGEVIEDEDEDMEVSANMSDTLDRIFTMINNGDTKNFNIKQYYISFAILSGNNGQIADYISTLAIKQMLPRIKNTLADNKKDRLFKKRLLLEFSVFKYFYFTLDSELEQIGVECRFDVDKIPDFECIDTDITAIAHNQCVTIIDKIFFIPTDELDLERICETLFNMISLEEYIPYLLPKSIDILIKLCEQLNKLELEPFYGGIAYKKLLKRKKEIEKLGRDS